MLFKSDGPKARFSHRLAVGMAAGMLASAWQAFGPLDYVGLARLLPLAGINVAAGLALGAISWLAIRSGGRAASALAALAIVVASGVLAHANIRRDIDVLLYVSDATSRRHLSLYGYERDTTPNLIRLADDDLAVVFEQAIAQGTVTWGGWPAILASSYPTMIGLGHGAEGLADKVTTLAEALKPAGYTTGGLVANPHLARALNFGQGFDYYEDSLQWADAFNAPMATGLFADWHQSAAGKKPRFGLVFVVDCHPGMYSATAEEVRRFRPEFDLEIRRWKTMIVPEFSATLETRREDLTAFYDASVRKVDGSFAALLAYLRAMGDLDKTLVVFTADHGEQFWEHGGFGHGGGPGKLYDEVLRIPLVVRFPSPVRFPRIRPAARKFPHQVGQIDLMPTILRFVGAPTDIGAMRGRSLLGYVYGRRKYDADRPLLSEAYSRGSRGRSWRTSGWKYTATYTVARGEERLVRERLFDLRSDPGEKRDVARAHAEVARSYRAALEREVGSMKPYLVQAPKGALTEEQRRRLKALGYLE